MNSLDCQNYLVAKHGQQFYDDFMEMSKECDPVEDIDSIRHYEKVAKNALSPNNWIRGAKYKVGSPIDMGLKDSNGQGHTGMELGKEFPQWLGGTYREFYIKDGDCAGTFGLIEFNGRIVHEEDLSD